MGLWEETKTLHSLCSAGSAQQSPNSRTGTLQGNHNMPFSHQLVFSHNTSLKLVIILHTQERQTLIFISLS